METVFRTRYLSVIAVVFGAVGAVLMFVVGAVTTIDGTGLGDSTVRCVSGEGPGSILDGFTVTGGTGGACPFNASLTCGGGMLVAGSGPTVRNCVFFQNQADFGGGVVNTGGSTTMLDDCRFDGNTASELGGGMYNDSSSAPVVTGSTFSGNAVASNYDTGAGGGEGPGDLNRGVEAGLVAEGVHGVARGDVLDVELACRLGAAHAAPPARSASRSAVRRAAEVMMSRLPA